MKKHLIFILILSAVCAVMHAGKGFTTSFTFPDMPDSTEIAVRIHDGKAGYADFRFDTVRIVDGNGILIDTVAVNYPVQAYAFTPAGTISLFVANGHSEQIEGNNDDIANLTLSYRGAPWSEDAMIYNSRVDGPLENANTAMKDYKKMTDAQRDSLIGLYQSIRQKELDLFMELPDSWITLKRLIFNMADMPRNNVQTIFDSLSPDKKASQYGEIVGRYLSITPIGKGSHLSDYDIEGRDQNGRLFKLSSVKEPYILLDFSQCYCGPCKMAAKEIATIAEEFKDHVAFINYSCDDTENDWNKAVARDSITWPSVFDGTGSTGTVSLKYNVNSYPTFVIYGPDRILVKTWTGYSPGIIKAELSKLLSSEPEK